MHNAIIFTDTNQQHGVFKSIGAPKIASVLRQAGFTCLVIDYATFFSLEELLSVVARAVSSSTLFVGFSSTFIMRARGRYELLNLGEENEVTLVAAIKKMNPNCKIVLGGSQATPNISVKYIDYSILGYAEASVLSLAYHLRDSTPLRNSHRNIHGVTIVDDRFGKEYDFIGSSFSWDSFDAANITVLPIEIARGCIFNCKFCAYPLNGKQQLDFMKSEEAIFTELQENYDRFGVTQYTFIDDTFNDNEYKLDMLLRVVKRLSFTPTFWAYIRLDLLTTRAGSLEKLFDIGLRSTYFGIETLNKQTGLIIGKGYDRAKQIAMLEKIRVKYGNQLITHGSFIVGLPKESVESVTSTANALMSGDIPLHSYIFTGLGIYKPGPAVASDISKNFTKYGYEEVPSDTPSPLVYKWKNEHMTNFIADAMAREFNQAGYKSGKFHVSGQTGTGLRNLGYSDEYVRETKFNEVNWDESTVRRNQFVAEYKILLDRKLNGN